MVVPVISYFGSRNIDLTPGPAYPAAYVKFCFVFFLTSYGENPFPMGIPLFPRSHELPTACVGEGSFTVGQSVFPGTFILGPGLVAHDSSPVLGAGFELAF